MAAIVGAFACVVCLPVQAAPVDFSREIQPLLARKCFACHGPDKQEGGLRLDESAGALAELESGGRAIVAGDKQASLILERITATDPDTRMPPEGPRLTPAQVNALGHWIEEGAAWQEHWAFRPLTRPAVPAVENAPHPIDAFIRAGLVRRGLPIPQPADKTALLRRATYDLTGLPPTQAELKDFLADESPQAFEKVVDRLLASPHYGEQWARHWLDLVRYADTKSFERDGAKPHAWRYRDYLIRSFNADKPFDQLTIEQIAGDELAEPSSDALIATGYYRLGVWDDEPADREQFRYDWLDDIVATTGQTFLGLTVNCARCHDHKIDPIPQRDYYSLLSFFQNIVQGPSVERPIFASPEARAEHDARVADRQRRIDASQQAVTAIETAFLAARDNPADAPTESSDLDDLAFRFYRDTWTKLPDFDSLKAEDVGPVASQHFNITVAPSLRPDAFGYVFTGFLKVPADGDYTFTLDSDDGSRLSIGGTPVVEYDGIHGIGQPKTATVSLKAGRLPIRLDYFQWEHRKGLSVAWTGPGFENRLLSEGKKKGEAATKLAEAIAAEGEKILGADGKRDYDAKVAALEAVKKESVPVEAASVVTEQGAQAPETFVLYRGNPHAETKPENRVEPAFPGILKAKQPVIPTPAPGAASTGRRTALAQWLVSPENQLTPRVLANRLWQYHFGRGIARSSSNFGMMGDPPTHPELLDWLAAELISGGWHLKPLHRQIMLSQAYQAASTGDAVASASDPLNDSFWRFDMRRLTAEEIRDTIHVASGDFNPKMGGPGVFVDIPKEVLAGQSRPGEGWGSSPAEEQARRSVYIHVKRSLITPILADFDLADTDTTCPVRFTTTQPTQALGMMNGAFLHKQARAFAARVKREVGGVDADNTQAEVRRALEIALTRQVSAEEVARGVALVDTLENADGVGPTRSLELFCLMVLNLNEFIYLD